MTKGWSALREYAVRHRDSTGELGSSCTPCSLNEVDNHDPTEALCIRHAKEIPIKTSLGQARALKPFGGRVAAARLSHLDIGQSMLPGIKEAFCEVVIARMIERAELRNCSLE